MVDELLFPAVNIHMTDDRDNRVKPIVIGSVCTDVMVRQNPHIIISPASEEDIKGWELIFLLVRSTEHS